VPKLPAPVEEDLSKGILEAIDMDSYRVEKTAIKIQLADADAEIEPVPTSGGGHKPEPELDRLSHILKTFNDQFGNIPWTDADRVHKLITEDITDRVAADPAYQNAKKNSDKQNARIESGSGVDVPPHLPHVHAVHFVDDLGESLNRALQAGGRNQVGRVHRRVVERVIDDVDARSHRRIRSQLAAGVVLRCRVRSDAEIAPGPRDHLA
jgi:hypothetical protein